MTEAAHARTRDRAGRRRADGRALRWAEHNENRREELIDAALRAIRVRGAGVGMDEIAAEAGTSKTVIYRHFGDRAGLYREVAAKVDRRIGRRMHQAIDEHAEPHQILAAIVDSYLSMTEADPEVYRFVVRPPMVEGGVAEQAVLSISGRVARVLANLIEPAVGHERAEVWATAVVGSVHSCADRWLASPDPLPRERLVAHLTELGWGGISSALNAQDVPAERPKDASRE